MHPRKAYGLQALAGRLLSENRAEYLRQCRRDNLLVGVAVGGALVMVGLSVMLVFMGI